MGLFHNEGVSGLVYFHHFDLFTGDTIFILRKQGRENRVCNVSLCAIYGRLCIYGLILCEVLAVLMNIKQHEEIADVETTLQCRHCFC